MSCIFKLLQGLYRDVKTSSNTKRIEYYDVSLNQFSAASQSHRCHDSSVTETSLPCMLSAIYILHDQYLALIESHPKLQFFFWARIHVPVKSLGVPVVTTLVNMHGDVSISQPVSAGHLPPIMGWPVDTDTNNGSYQVRAVVSWYHHSPIKLTIVVLILH